MFEDDGITPLPHQKYGFTMPLAVSAVLHGALVAVLLCNAVQPDIREEMVKVFVIGEAAISTPGVGGESGPPGASPATGSSQSKPETAGPVQRAAAPKLRNQRASASNRNEAPQEQIRTTVAAEPLRNPPTEQILSPPNPPGGDIVASIGRGAGITGSGSDTGAAGVATGNGSGNGSAGFGSGTGGEGTGSGGIVTTRFGMADAPLFKYREAPRYPVAARRRGEEGRVLLRLTIDEKGKLVNVNVMESSGTDFTEAAVEAVQRSRFVPAKRNNTPIMSMALLPIRFELKP
jgi:protein TonB